MQRSIARVVAAETTEDGAGARVLRAFPSPRLLVVDPFVMLDDFQVTPPAGFPDHPHRGFEIITYMLEGAFRHRDNLGNDRTVVAGGLQRITAGRGIWHSEIPGTPGMNRGLQLWVNLPQRLKQLEPEYQEVLPQEIPETTGPGYRVRTVVGEGSPTRLRTPVVYLDVALEPGATWSHPVPPEFDGLLYVVSGTGRFGAEGTPGAPGQVLILGPGEEVPVTAGVEPLRFALIAGRPHREPIRLRGPFVD